MLNIDKSKFVTVALRYAKYNKDPEIFINLIYQYKDENWIGLGGNRAVFKRKNFVVKVPMNLNGVYDNQSEAKQYSELKKTSYIPFAACRMACEYLLVMEYVSTPTVKNYPEWVKSVDSQQVGFDRKGRLVAYDYSNHWG